MGQGRHTLRSVSDPVYPPEWAKLDHVVIAVAIRPVASLIASDQ